MSWILSRPLVRGIVVGILPGLALQIFLALVPSILRVLNRLQGIYTRSSDDFEVRPASPTR